MLPGISSAIVNFPPVVSRRLLTSFIQVMTLFLPVPLLSAQVASERVATTVSGQVLNAKTGVPMARVLIQANAQAGFTSAEGRFQFTDPGGIKSLQFTKPGFWTSPEQRDPQSVTVNASASEVNLEIELWPEAILTGTVTSSEGDPLPQIAVTAQRSLLQSGVRQTLPAGTTLTDAHGGFRMPVPAGDYVLQTRYAAPDFNRSLAILPVQVPAHSVEDGTDTIHITSGQELHFDLHSQLATAFHITLPLDESATQRTPSISVTTANGATYQPPRRVTSEGIELDLPSGVYKLSARMTAPDGDRIAHLTLTVPERDSVGPALHLELVPSVPVVVTADLSSASSAATGGSSPPDASGLNLQLEPRASAFSEDGGQLIRLAVRGAGGTSFRVPPGAYRLAGGEDSGWTIESATYGGVDLLTQPLVVGTNVGAEPIRIVVARASGTVTGVTRRAGVPASCWVVFVADAGTLPHFFIRRSESSGDFSVSGLPFRRFNLLALPLLSSADFGDPAVLDRFQTYVQKIEVTPSSSAALTLEAPSAHELYP